MKLFRVRLVQDLTISFEDDRASVVSAEHVATKCWGARSLVGDLGLSKSLGRWTARLEGAEVESIKEGKP